MIQSTCNKSVVVSNGFSTNKNLLKTTNLYPELLESNIPVMTSVLPSTNPSNGTSGPSVNPTVVMTTVLPSANSPLTITLPLSPPPAVNLVIFLQVSASLCTLMQPRSPKKTQQQSKRKMKKKRNNSVFSIRSKLLNYLLLLMFMVFFFANTNATNETLINKEEKIEMVKNKYQSQFKINKCVKIECIQESKPENSQLSRLYDECQKRSETLGVIIYENPLQISLSLKLGNPKEIFEISALEENGFQLSLYNTELQIVEEKTNSFKKTEIVQLIERKIKKKAKHDEFYKFYEMQKGNVYGIIIEEDTLLLRVFMEIDDDEIDGMEIFVSELEDYNLEISHIGKLFEKGDTIRAIQNFNTNTYIDSNARNENIVHKEIKTNDIITVLDVVQTGDPEKWCLKISEEGKKKSYFIDIKTNLANIEIETKYKSKTIFLHKMLKIIGPWMILFTFFCAKLASVDHGFLWIQSSKPLEFISAGIVILCLTQSIAIYYNIHYIFPKAIAQKGRKNPFPLVISKFYKAYISIYLLAPKMLIITIPGYGACSFLLYLATLNQYLNFDPDSNKMPYTTHIARTLSAISSIGLFLLAAIRLEIQEELEPVLKPKLKWSQSTLVHCLAALVLFITLDVYQLIQTSANFINLFVHQNIYFSFVSFVSIILQLFTSMISTSAISNYIIDRNAKYEWLSVSGFLFHTFLSAILTYFGKCKFITDGGGE